MSVPHDLEVRFATIAQNNARGAADLANEAAHALIQLAGLETFQTLEEARSACIDAVLRLVAGQPAMAPLVFLANVVLASVEEVHVLNRLREAVRSACESFLQRLERNKLASAVHAASLIAPGATVLTHSFSSTVYEALMESSSAGKHPNVVCTESRPVCEGVALATALRRAHLQVTLVVDAAAFSLLNNVHLVLVGADAVSEEGVVNKIGTSGLALAARERGVPCYAVCDSTKYLPATYPFPLHREQNPSEVLASPPPELRVLNYYFDRTPLENFTGIVTEEGVVSAAAVRERLKTLRLHPRLC